MRYPKPETIINLVPRLPSWGSGASLPRLTWKRKPSVIDIREGERLRAEAYEWACKESERYKIAFCNLVFEGDSMTAQDPHRIDELFVGLDGKALLRQLWPEKGKVAYIRICNFDEVKNEVPFYVGHMCRNGISSYCRYRRCRRVVA